jgi:hypothetical protein
LWRFSTVTETTGPLGLFPFILELINILALTTDLSYKKHTAIFMQIFLTTLSDHFNTPLESTMLGYESDEKVFFFSVCGLMLH